MIEAEGVRKNLEVGLAQGHLGLVVGNYQGREEAYRSEDHLE